MPRGVSAAKSNTTAPDKKRQPTLERLQDMALVGAPDAMTAVVEAAQGKPVSRERLAAAMYLLNQVWGKPADKEPSTNAADALQEILNDIRSLPGRGGAVVEPASS